jgi:hypothetical protein
MLVHELMAALEGLDEEAEVVLHPALYDVGACRDRRDEYGGRRRCPHGDPPCWHVESEPPECDECGREPGALAHDPAGWSEGGWGERGQHPYAPAHPRTTVHVRA